jgi:hypothetical protein
MFVAAESQTKDIFASTLKYRELGGSVKQTCGINLSISFKDTGKSNNGNSFCPPRQARKGG